MIEGKPFDVISDDHLIIADNFDDLYTRAILALNLRPQYVCSPRGQKIKENLVTTLVLTNPRARLISSEARDVNYGFAVGEFLWYWQGKQDLKTMLYYNKRMKDFSNDGETLNSAYGYRLKSLMFFDIDRVVGSGLTQWEVVKHTLVSDSDSRRAVMLINEPNDEYTAASIGSKDVPCTLSLQFFVRENKLDLHVLMRSNDVIWGLPYDLFSFTLFQECMLLDLRKEEKFKDLQLGTYYHTAGSLHIYERHFDLGQEIVDEWTNKKDVGLLKNRPQRIGPISDLESLDLLCRMEEPLRTEKIIQIDPEKFEGGLVWMAKQLNDHRTKRDYEKEKR